MKLFIPLYTSNKRIATKAIIIMQRAQNGVSMKMKANTYTTKKQIVEEMLIENYAKYYKLAYSYVRNESDAQDIVQEGAYKAILNCNSLKNDSYADTWIYRIMINEAITHFRRKKKETVGMDNLLETETITDSYQDIDLYHAIDALETLDRTILTLRYFEELKLEQIAQITQQNLNTVKTRLYRTLKKLRLTFLSNEDI